jgi:hypothetical protein
MCAGQGVQAVGPDKRYRHLLDNETVTLILTAILYLNKVMGGTTGGLGEGTRVGHVRWELKKMGDD